MANEKVLRSRLAPTGKASELAVTVLAELLNMFGITLDSYHATNGRVTIALKQRVNRLFKAVANRYNKTIRESAKAAGRAVDARDLATPYDVIKDAYDPDGGVYDLSTKEIINLVDGLVKDAQLGLNLSVDDIMFVFNGIVREYVENPNAKEFITINDILSDDEVEALDNTRPVVPAKAKPANGDAQHV